MKRINAFILILIFSCINSQRLFGSDETEEEFSLEDGDDEADDVDNIFLMAEEPLDGKAILSGEQQIISPKPQDDSSFALPDLKRKIPNRPSYFYSITLPTFIAVSGTVIFAYLIIHLPIWMHADRKKHKGSTE